MTYDEMILSIETINAEQHCQRSAIPHGSNLLHQLNKRDDSKIDMFEEILPLYLATRTVEYAAANVYGYIDAVVDNVNTYMNYFWPPAQNPFSHQADYTSSIIPEMLCTIFGNIINSTGADLEVSAEKDLTIECTFDVAGGGKVRFKNKRVDVAVVKPCSLVFNGEESTLPIPLLAIECKTNLDKNMLSGIEQSVGDLKKTFPMCNYYVVTELSDFDVKRTNYASSGIDEMYVLRKQKRGMIRRFPELRNPIDVELIVELAKSLICSIDVLCAESVDLNSRMLNGKLIGRIE